MLKQNLFHSQSHEHRYKEMTTHIGLTVSKTSDHRFHQYLIDYRVFPSIFCHSYFLNYPIRISLMFKINPRS